jgi:DNA-binding NarL/FixJ family response regulator
MNEKTRILIADDHALLRMGLTSLIGYQPDMTVIGEACNGHEAVRLANKLHPDLVLMDLVMPGIDGLEATRLILADLPATKIFILTSYPESIELARALTLGAAGAASKDTPNDELLALLRRVVAGDTVIPASIHRHIKTLELLDGISERQLEFLQLAARGFSNEDIARHFSITLNGVKKQFSALFQKLGAANRTEAVALAQSAHLI